MRQKHTKNYSFTLSRGQVIFIGILCLLLCSVFFSLGLVGGYGMFVSSLREKLPKQGDIKSSREKSEEASFYETLDDDVPRIEAKDQPVQQEDSPAPTISSAYQVQVGAFRHETEARTLQERLQKQGYKSNVAKVDLHGKGIWFRVRAGNCATKEQAAELAKKLRKENLPTLIVR